MLHYCLLVTGPAYGTQQASSAYQFAQALLHSGHRLVSVFFYREGVLNANQLTAPAGDEFDLVRAWQQLACANAVELNVCVGAALRRGITANDKQETCHLNSVGNLQQGFSLRGLGALAETILSCDRVVQF